MYDEITIETLQASILANASAAGWSVVDGTLPQLLAAPIATELWKRYQASASEVSMFYVDETSGGYIDLMAECFGITRKDGARATAAITLTGTAGVTIPSGTIFLTADGLEFDLTDAVTLGETGTGTGAIEAADVGDAYNIEAGSLTKMYVNLSGLTGYTNAAATGGVDGETDAALCTRLYARLQAPATSGNAYAYEQWALSVDGVGAVKVSPLASGAGTVGVLLVGSDMAPVDSAVVDAVAAYIEEERPIGATVTVESATALTINVAATVTIDSSTTLEEVQTALVSKLDTYLKSIVFANYTLLYNRVSYLLLSIDGVSDYTALTVNGGTANITIGAGEVPVVGTVVIS